MTLTPWGEGPIPDPVMGRAHASARRGRLPRVGDGVTARVDLLESYAELVAVAMARARFLGELLADQLDAHGGDEGNPYDYTGGGLAPEVRGLIGQTVQVSVVGNGPSAELDVTPTGEEVRALVRLEAEERDRAARLIEKALRIGVSLQQVEMLRTYGTTVATALQTYTLELGLSLDDEPVLRAAQRAGLTARRQLGQDDGDPDRVIGPRMAPSERVTALREALKVAEADMARQRAVTP